MGLDAAALHLGEDAVDRLRAEPVAGSFRRGEEVQAETLPTPFLAQLAVHPEDKLEDGSAAHRARLVGVSCEAHGDAAAVHRLDAIANRLRRGDALARRDGVLDAGELLDEASATADDESVVLDRAGGGLERAPVRAQSGRLPGEMAHAHPLEEGAQIDAQILAAADAAGHPNQARIVDEFGLGADERDLGVGCAPSNALHGGEAGESGTDDGDAMHG